MAENIEISYKTKPPGQVGPKPRRIPVNGAFRFTSNDPGVLTIEFLNDSPMADGSKKVGKDNDFTAAKPGKYPFKCILEVNGQTVTLGDPNDPSSPAGGELEVGPG